MVSAKMALEQQIQTLQPTALVHEAYLRLVGKDDGEKRWNSRGHFFGAAAEAMRRILIDQARARKRLKRGGDHEVFSLDSVGPLDVEKADEIIQLSDALDALAEQHPDKAKLVKLKYFVGLNTNEIADILQISLRTAERDWAYARAWLYRAMSNDTD